MKRFYIVFALIAATMVLVSFSANPPDGKTGAPGDGLCIECHSPTNPPINGTISVEGFPASITPGESYLLTVVNRDTSGNAAKGGFQMTILSPTNTKAGDLTNPSSNSVVTTFNGRQYFEHNPAQNYPDSNVLRWTVEWTAPMLDPGSQITWYAAGNIANGNFNNSGDRIVTDSGSGSIILAGVEDLLASGHRIYPNPGSDHINLELDNGIMPDGVAEFYSLTGSMVNTTAIQGGRMNTSELASGVYMIRIKTNDKTYAVRWAKL